MLVAINAGHCPGKDPGAMGKTISEAELAKQYAQLVIKYLQAAGVDTLFIQEDSLSLICNIANTNNADLFLSIHFNAFNGSAHGTETLYCNGSQKGKVLAECIQKQLIDTLHLTDRGLKTNSLYVTNYTNMPGILTEVGFIDNAEEEQVLVSKKDDACRAIARGVTDAINKLYTSSSTPKSTKASKPTQSSSRPGMVSKYFSADEVSCHCCGRNGTKQVLLDFLDDLREAIGQPLFLTCAYRCPSHNAEVGGVPNSQHVLGYAADCYCDGLTVHQLAEAGRRLNADGIGIYEYSQFVHFDVRDGRIGSDIIWYG